MGSSPKMRGFMLQPITASQEADPEIVSAYGYILGTSPNHSLAEIVLFTMLH